MTGMIGSESIASRKTGTPLLRRALRTWLVFGLVSMLITLSACGGGGFNDNNNGPSTLTVTVNNVSTVTSGAGDSAVRVDFTVQGDTGQAFTLLFQYFVDTNANGVLDGGETLLNMTEVSMALEAALGITSQGDIAGFASGQNMAVATFLWQAGADLGFIGSPFGVVIIPNGMSGQTTQSGSTASAITYNAGNPPVVFSGSIGAAGAMGAGRTAHTSAGVSDLSANATLTDLGNEILVVGGSNGTSDLNNIDRFTVDGNARTLMASGTFNSANVRIQHASASFFSSTSSRVLVTGGSIGGTATNTADVYAFGPSGAESVTATATMNNARRLHGACWLPDNTVFVHGGFNGSNTAQNTAEIFRPGATPGSGTFTALTVPGSVPARVQHTQCVLPNGMVLIAGGHDGSNNPLNAFLYDPKTNTWTDTGTQVNRVNHTSTLLVNGVCALIGGHNAGSTSPLATATFYRTFPEDDNGNMIPAGFTTIAITMPSTARSNHAASRLASGGLLVTGGFGSGNNTLGSSELFVPSKFTDPAIGFFTQTNPGAVANQDMVDSRANHTQTTTGTGSAVVIGGVTGNTSTNTALSTIEVFQFQNAAPTVSNITAVTTNANDVPITFTLADAEDDRSFVVIRFSTDGGTTFQFATLTDYASTVNLAPGTKTLRWNAAADGVVSPAGTIIEIVPVGGVVGAPVRATI